MTTSDSELLQQFARDRSEEAFAILVKRHVDLVYSAAFRLVHSSQLAEEVAQSVFVDLSRNADKLKPDTILTAWLYRVTHRTSVDVIRNESRRQVREKISVELADMKSPDAHWKEIEPLLEEAMEALEEDDRTSILLRYFENKSLREVGETFGISDDTAQKRVSRAVERLREFFSKRGVAIGATSLVILSANAVQAAPGSLAVTISAVATTTVQTSTALAAKTIAMTTLQKTFITATLLAAVATGVYELNLASTLREQNQLLARRVASLRNLTEQLQRERDQATNQFALLTQENKRSNQNMAELLKLRSEVGRLRQENQTLARVDTANKKEAQLLGKGFGNLGDYLPIENLSDVGTSSAEALLTTSLWAIRENKLDRLEEIDSPFGGQNKSKDAADEPVAAQVAAFLNILQGALTNSAGFHLSSRAARNNQQYEVRLDAAPLTGKDNDFIKNFHVSFVLEKKTNGWAFGDTFDEPKSK
jgi:RNA polymerase sigma factor (sigma-70 family)